MQGVCLRRVDPVRKMRRFYRIGIETDLFGDVLLVKQWGRIGKCGRMSARRYDSEATALEALQRQADLKMRRGYEVVG